MNENKRILLIFYINSIRDILRRQEIDMNRVDIILELAKKLNSTYIRETCIVKSNENKLF